jgi:hypothetical protein
MLQQIPMLPQPSNFTPSWLPHKALTIEVEHAMNWVPAAPVTMKQFHDLIATSTPRPYLEEEASRPSGRATMGSPQHAGRHLTADSPLSGRSQSPRKQQRTSSPGETMEEAASPPAVTEVIRACDQLDPLDAMGVILHLLKKHAALIGGELEVDGTTQLSAPPKQKGEAAAAPLEHVATVVSRVRALCRDIQEPPPWQPGRSSFHHGTAFGNHQNSWLQSSSNAAQRTKGVSANSLGDGPHEGQPAMSHPNEPPRPSGKRGGQEWHRGKGCSANTLGDGPRVLRRPPATRASRTHPVSRASPLLTISTDKCAAHYRDENGEPIPAHILLCPEYHISLRWTDRQYHATPMQGYCWLVAIARAVSKSDEQLADYPRFNLRTYDHLSAIVAVLRPTMTRAREDPLLQGSEIMWNTWAALCESAENRSPLTVWTSEDYLCHVLYARLLQHCHLPVTLWVEDPTATVSNWAQIETTSTSSGIYFHHGIISPLMIGTIWPRGEPAASHHHIVYAE